MVIADWGSNRHNTLTLVVPVTTLAWAVRLFLDTRRQAGVGKVTRSKARKLTDVAMLAATVAGGLIADIVVGAPNTAASQSNTGFAALSMSTFLGAALCPSASAAITVAAAVGHGWALRWAPTEAVQGGVLLLLTWMAVSRVVREIHRAGGDADVAIAAAGASEREDASARIHDGLTLLRLVVDSARPRSS